MAQLSLFKGKEVQEIPAHKENQAKFYCDIFVCSCEYGKKKRIRIKPLPNQAADNELYVSCSHKARHLFPVGTIFKMDLRLAYSKKGNKYLKAIAGKPLQRALEYFEHNLALQKATRPES